ncbi:type VI secretion system lipoprotein TssJ [Rhizobium sp. SEMIA 4085]|uniref:Type VI protein secretion system lipoprotein n=1 Tax=Rhizobium gallicum bv. gallicum R602sp TaxID=1041138 RepID=A0A0B4XG25_9HYPH|nr:MULTISPECIES: type VI secretion system lipoprotein TssJ [Rhizobium]AJD45427.1 type VI protein secretion system lipoprotein [Rhizobium gallicum bv. gallicum R602sp]NNH32032.1 type VI secretion system lipoprotein TssJ [Rhizobium sp. SEMIA 4085]
MLNRRDFIMVIGATGALSACMGGPPKSSTVTVTATGQAGMNAAAGGGERPVTLLILRLKDVGKFNSADIFALQSDPSGALGADLVGSEQMTVAPGASASKTVAFPPEATFLGLVALFREPGGRTWRRSVPIRPESTVTANVVLGRGGMALALA